METNNILEGDGIIILLLFFLMSGWGGFGGNNNGTFTRGEMAEGFNISEIKHNQNDMMYSIMQNRYDTAIGDANLGRDIMENRYAAALQAQTAQAQTANCCCDLKTAIHAEGEATRAMIQQQTIDDLKYQLGQANTAISNAVQTQNILNSLGRYYTNPPVNPYAVFNGYNAYGNGGCGCGNIA